MNDASSAGELTSGTSTFVSAVYLAKLCMGAGILAIPYSFKRGGLILSPIGLGIVAVWNAISCHMIIRCKRCCSDNVYPYSISSQFAKLALSGLGWKGVYIANFCLLFTLLGVCVSYQTAFISLLLNLPFVYLNQQQLALISAILVYPLCCIKDLQFLSVLSVLGLGCLLAGMLTIMLYGFHLYKLPENNLDSYSKVPNWPESAGDFCSFVGVAVFCYGYCTLALNVEENMKHKDEFMKAVIWSLFFVWVLYVTMGDIIGYLFSHIDTGEIKSNILANLPPDSITSNIVRSSMSIVCLFTFPLTFIPASRMIEYFVQDKISSRKLNWNSNARYDRIEDLNSIRDENNFILQDNTPIELRCFVRAALVILCTIFAIYVPCFGMIVSLLGCFTESIISFILPPLLHMNIVTWPSLLASNLNLGEDRICKNSQVLKFLQEDYLRPKTQYYANFILICLGCFVCVVTTSITAVDIYFQLQRHENTC